MFGISPWLIGASLTALHKKSGGFHSIVVGEMLFLEVEAQCFPIEGPIRFGCNHGNYSSIITDMSGEPCQASQLASVWKACVWYFALAYRCFTHYPAQEVGRRLSYRGWKGVTTLCKLCLAARPQLSEVYLLYGQVSVGTKGGLEASIHAARIFIQGCGHEEELHCLKLNMKNAFNECI